MKNETLKPDKTIDKWQPEAGKPAQVKLGGMWFDTFIIGYDSDGDCVFEVTYEMGLMDSHYDDYVYDSYPESVTAKVFRPIKSEADKFCEKLEEITDGMIGKDDNIAITIYNAIKSGKLEV